LLKDIDEKLRRPQDFDSRGEVGESELLIEQPLGGAIPRQMRDARAEQLKPPQQHLAL
jgi:hypothetical protein